MKKIFILSMLSNIFQGTAMCADTDVKQIYQDLRKAALHTSYESLGLEFSGDKIAVYGTFIERRYGDALAIITAYGTGDASVYISHGGGYIGGIGIDAINKAAKDFVGFSQNYLPLAKKSDDFSFPEGLEVKFYFLTNKGVYIAKDSMSNKDSKLIPLYIEGEKIFMEYIKHQNNNNKPK